LQHHGPPPSASISLPLPSRFFSTFFLPLKGSKKGEGPPWTNGISTEAEWDDRDDCFLNIAKRRSPFRMVVQWIFIRQIQTKIRKNFTKFATPFPNKTYS
jgi:hypothetical protein